LVVRPILLQRVDRRSAQARSLATKLISSAPIDRPRLRGLSIVMGQLPLWSKAEGCSGI